MTKSELRDKIKGLVSQVYKPGSFVDLDGGNSTIDLEIEKFPMLLKFPELKRVLVDLLTTEFETFVKDIQWVAPKPTTFRIVLANNEIFYLIWAVRSWIAKVEGKKYYLLNLNEEESAIESIARMLEYGVSDAEMGDEAELAAADTASTTSSPGDDAGENSLDIDVDDESDIEVEI
jgi:hypothetical protein